MAFDWSLPQLPSLMLIGPPIKRGQRIAMTARLRNGPQSWPGAKDLATSTPPKRRSVDARTIAVPAHAYLPFAIGSIPLVLIASAARGEAKNAINRLALSTSSEPATMAAENT
jgi:hypothetical protein